MLRKLTHIVLALFLMIATTGITLSMHYCGDKLVAASIQKAPNSCCDGMSGCCENKTFHYEVKDDFIGSASINKIEVIDFDLLFSVLFVLRAEQIFSVEIENHIIYDISPPPIQKKLSLLQTYLC